MSSHNNWYVYILQCSDNTLYTGITTDVDRRLDEHNHDNQKGARYTRCRRPVTLIYHETVPDRSSASKREAQLKKLPRQKKLALINERTIEGTIA